MSDDKVYSPQEIVDQPFPGEGDEVAVSQKSAGSQVYSPSSIKETPLPKKVIAQETISSSLNTKSKKILDSYEFTQQGAIQIGKFVDGSSGDIRITPDGITARDTTGSTTFAIDAETGDATFRGTVQAAGFDIIDSTGLKSISSFSGDLLQSNTVTTTTSTSYVDVTGSSFNINAERDLQVYFNIYAAIGMTDFLEYLASGTLCTVQLYDSFLAGQAIGELSSPGFGGEHNEFMPGFTGVTQSWIVTTAGISMGGLLTVGKGTHNYKLRIKRDGTGGTAQIVSFVISILILGT